MNRHGEDVLTALGELDGTEEEFDDLVEELSLASRKHVSFQEPIFLRLREQVSRDDLVELGAQVAGARETEEQDEAGGRPADREGQPSTEALRQSEQQTDEEQD